MENKNSEMLDDELMGTSGFDEEKVIQDFEGKIQDDSSLDAEKIIEEHFAGEEDYFSAKDILADEIPDDYFEDSETVKDVDIDVMSASSEDKVVEPEKEEKSIEKEQVKEKKAKEKQPKIKKSEQDSEKQKTGNKVYKVFLVLFVLVLIACICVYVFYWRNKANSANVYEELADATIENVTETQDMSDVDQDNQVEQIQESFPEKNLDWNDLWQTNDDIYAWIYIPGTSIDYPVLSSSPDEDEDLYLDHNLDKKYGPYPGAIYSQRTRNAVNFSDYNLVLYGHNMKDGTMFSDLHNYNDLAYFEENNFIYMYSPKGNYKYEIFAAYETDNQLLFDKYNFASEYGYMQYLDEVLTIRDMNAHVSSDVVPTSKDRIITLSTCISGHHEKRWLVQGVLVAEE